VLFYGEEIGMAENLAMDGREAVRLPMQWADRPSGGFTTAEESSMPRQMLRTGQFGYHELNVEEQQGDRGSLMNWMETAIRRRKEWPEFGWGAWQVLPARSSKVLAHIATWDGSSAMAVHNFSDQAQRLTVQIPQDARTGRWQHVFGPLDGDVPEIRDGRLSFELPAYGYHWFGRREGV
jgi:maltose alpha-D-glucosyltransferase/alpha-amylase